MGPLVIRLVVNTVATWEAVRLVPGGRFVPDAARTCLPRTWRRLGVAGPVLANALACSARATRRLEG
jgi:hypothetical protein